MAKKRKAVKAKKPESYRADRYGIQNHVGGIWTPETFQTPDQAQHYLDAQRPHYKGIGRHKVIPVRVTITQRAAG